MFEQTIKNFNINFNTLNGRNVFSSGDHITGHISFDLTKETKITSITMKLKGGANVHWSTGGSKNRRHHTSKLEFFKFKSVIMQGSGAVGGTSSLPPGRHMYPISCQLPQGDFPSSFRAAHGQILYALTVGIDRPWHISKDFVTELNFVNHIDTSQPELWGTMPLARATTPFNLPFRSQQDLPSSFTGRFGKVLYALEAVLSRSMRRDSKAKMSFTLVNKANLNSHPLLKTPQQCIVDKKMKLFTSGKVTMDINIPQTGFYQERCLSPSPSALAGESGHFSVVAEVDVTSMSSAASVFTMDHQLHQFTQLSDHLASQAQKGLVRHSL